MSSIYDRVQAISYSNGTSYLSDVAGPLSMEDVTSNLFSLNSSYLLLSIFVLYKFQEIFVTYYMRRPVR